VVVAMPGWFRPKALAAKARTMPDGSYARSAVVDVDLVVFRPAAVSRTDA
jgi:hypothetical protein